MTLRPVSARWFEILIARDDLLKMADALARSGNVELETHSEITKRAIMPDLRDRLEDYNRLMRRYQVYWPNQDLSPSDVPGQPAERMDNAMEKLNAWKQAVDSVINLVETLQNEQIELSLLSEFFMNMQSDIIDFSYFVNAGPVVMPRLFILPIAARIAHLPPSVLIVRVTTDQHIFLLSVGSTSDLNSLQHDLIVLKGRVVILPKWLAGNRWQAYDQVQHRLNKIQQDIHQHKQRIAELSETHKLTKALGDIQQIEWFLTHINDLPVTENFAWITGWTNDVSGTRLNCLLEKTTVRAVIHYPSPPMGLKSPMVMRNPGWTQPFEFFAKLLGTPAKDEIDPSMLLTVVVPLLFGYMFGDVGQGMVLFMIGVLLQKRWPILKVLIGCGIASMVFGFIFGSVFSIEHVIEPLWVNPIEEPLHVLFLPMIGGIVILFLGLLLNSVQAYWRAELTRWLLIDAAVIVMYLGIIGSFINFWFIVAFVFGLCWYFAGNAAVATGHIAQALGVALGQLLENLLQLIINTISFIRVGAFALAHAGLSLAVMVLANTLDNIILAGIVIITGNIIILVLEGMVVSIQTTRLILFEFFIRFLRGTGRVFRPLVAPQTTKQTSQQQLQQLRKNYQGEQHGHAK